MKFQRATTRTVEVPEVIQFDDAKEAVEFIHGWFNQDAQAHAHRWGYHSVPTRGSLEGEKILCEAARVFAQHVETCYIRGGGKKESQGSPTKESHRVQQGEGE